MRAEALKGHLDAMLLAILADGPAHGYAVMEVLRLRSGGTFALPSGTIYPALHRLEIAGLLRGNWETVGGRQRRVYQLTPRGRSELNRERRSWRTFAYAVDALLGSA